MHPQPRLSFVSPEEASGDIKAIYQGFEEMIGSVPAPIQMFSVSPGALKLMADSIKHAVTSSSVPGNVLAMIRMLVSKSTNCEFCVDFNKAMLHEMGYSLDDLQAACNDVNATPLPDNEKELVFLAMKVAQTPHQVSVEDIQKVRDLGWEDMAIFDAADHAAKSIAHDALIEAFGIPA